MDLTSSCFGHSFTVVFTASLTLSIPFFSFSPSPCPFYLLSSLFFFPLSNNQTTGASRSVLVLCLCCSVNLCLCSNLSLNRITALCFACPVAFSPLHLELVTLLAHMFLLTVLTLAFHTAKILHQLFASLVDLSHAIFLFYILYLHLTQYFLLFVVN